jgi:AraC-like DNA-binding protein/predicted transcriptional regulator YdeE
MSDYLSTVNLLIEYIEENIESDLSLDSLAKRVNYSVYYIQRVFSAVTHIPLHDYITERRLIRAGEEILNGDKVIDAALKYGYSSHNGFTKAFEKKFGLPPSRVNECVDIIVDRPLRILERNFYNKDGNLCICHKLIYLEELLLEGDIFTVNLKDFWNSEKMIHYIENKVISFINVNKNNETYCVGIPGNSNSEVQYFIGKIVEKDMAYIHKHQLVIPKSQYIKFSFRGNIKENPNMIITDALKCFITCGITPYQEKIDHIEIFNGDYSQTKVFDIIVPIKKA